MKFFSRYRISSLSRPPPTAPLSPPSSSPSFFLFASTLCYTSSFSSSSTFRSNDTDASHHPPPPPTTPTSGSTGSQRDLSSSSLPPFPLASPLRERPALHLPWTQRSPTTTTEHDTTSPLPTPSSSPLPSSEPQSTPSTTTTTTTTQSSSRKRSTSASFSRRNTSRKRAFQQQDASSTSRASSSSAAAAVLRPSSSRTPIAFSPYQETLARPLIRRHVDLREAGKKKKDLLPTDVRSSSSPPASFTKKTFDPALVVQVDSRKKKIFLNPIQKSLIWEARRKQYQQCLETIVRTLQSHLTPVEKCLHLMHLHETQVIPQRLRLRDDTYEDIFHTFYATATLVRSHPRSSSTGGGGGSAPFSANPSSAYRYGAQQHAATTVEEAEEAEAVAYGEGGEYSGKGGAVSGPSFIFGVPMELATRSAAALTLTSEETMQEWWKMYRYMVDSGTNPTPRILQHVMGLLEQRARWRLGTGKGKRKVPSPTGATTSAAMAPLPPPVPGLAILEAKAHSLMLDADRFHFSPTTYTVNSYIFLCQVCGVMHLALARVCDLWKRWQTQPTSATYAMLLHGFLHQRLPSTGSPPSPTMKEDTTTSAALSVLTSMQSTPITIGLLQEILQVLRYSPDPLSAFTVYKSVMSRRTREGLERPSAAAAAGLIAPTLHTFSILVEVLLRVSEPLSMGKHVKEENRERKQSNEEKNHASAAAETLASSPSSSTAAASFPKHLLTFLLQEMKRYGIRGNALVLNKILECFCRSGQWNEFRALRQTMKKRGILVFDEYREL